jgi:predicted nucleic acid-binding protein
MIVRVFLDSNVLIYALSADQERGSIAQAALARGGVISVQVLNEVASVSIRKLGLSWSDATDTLRSIRALTDEPVPIDLSIHERALELSARYGSQIYDALIVAAALSARCDVLLTEDMQDGQVIEGTLRIQNPFRQS